MFVIDESVLRNQLTSRIIRKQHIMWGVGGEVVKGNFTNFSLFYFEKLLFRLIFGLEHPN